jgi:hypothetical protein
MQRQGLSWLASFRVIRLELADSSLLDNLREPEYTSRYFLERLANSPRHESDIGV